jgi:hypothetical protein
MFRKYLFCFHAHLELYPAYFQLKLKKEIGKVEPYPKDDKPVFIGHYCLEPHVPKISDNVVCIDGCVTCGKRLWAYRHSAKQKLASANLVHAEY